VVIPALVAAAPPLVPWPAWFGLLATLQNVATISSWQIAPVLVSGELFVTPPAPSGCCTDCAATGDAAKSSAETIATFVISATCFFRAPPIHYRRHSARRPGKLTSAASGSHMISDAAAILARNVAHAKVDTNALQSYSTRSLYVRPPSDNTASQNMFLNIFFVRLSIHT
jgi:hypothetical protein